MASGTVLHSTNNSTMTLRYSGTDGQAKVIEVPSTSGTMATEEKSLITLGTAQATTSGTFKDFTIPSGVKRVTVMFYGISTNGTSSILVQLGDSGGIEATDYESAGIVGITTTIASSATLITNGLASISSGSASSSFVGQLSITNIQGYTWVGTHIFGDKTAIVRFISGTSAKTLSSTLTTVRITTVNGTDLFDAGTVNVSWEF